MKKTILTVLFAAFLGLGLVGVSFALSQKPMFMNFGGHKYKVYADEYARCPVIELPDGRIIEVIGQTNSMPPHLIWSVVSEPRACTTKATLVK